MTLPNALVATELAAVNIILGATGQAPVTTLDQTSPDVAIAYDRLQDVNREIQSEGWGFNRESEYPLAPDSNGHILIPINTLMVDLSDIVENAGIDVSQRDGKLYNKTDHTFVWDEEVKVDIVWFFDWADLPTVFRDLITNRAAVQAAMEMTGDPATIQLLQQKEAFSRASAMEYECNQGDYSFFGHPMNRGYYSSYQPFKTLSR